MNKIKVLLDSSAILALLYQEPGADRVKNQISHRAQALQALQRALRLSQ